MRVSDMVPRRRWSEKKRHSYNFKRRQACGPFESTKQPAPCATLSAPAALPPNALPTTAARLRR
jgi:hypothetical protein